MADYGAEPVVGIRLNGDAQAAAAGQIDDAHMMYDGHGYSLNGDSMQQQPQQQQQYQQYQQDEYMDYGAEHNDLSSVDDIPVTQEDAWAVIS
jgi:hypothetical protein